MELWHEIMREMGFEIGVIAGVAVCFGIIDSRNRFVWGFWVILLALTAWSLVTRAAKMAFQLM